MSSTSTIPGPRETGRTSGSSNILTCGITRNWDQYRNSVKRDPCQIAFDLVDNFDCSSRSNVSQDLSQDLKILIRTSDADRLSLDSHNDCLCSSPVYSLVSFCRQCQDDASFLPSNSWEAWSANCSTRNEDGSSTNFVPFPIQSRLDEVHAPKWVDDRAIIVNGTFSFDVVRLRVEAGDRSEFGLPPDSTSGETPDTGNSGSNGENSHQAASPSKAPVGPIVGGVVGGVALIALLGLLFWFIRRRKQVSKEAPSAAYIRTCGGRLPVAPTPTPYSPHVGSDRASWQYPNEKAILAERELQSQNNASMVSMEKPLRQDSDASTTSEAFDPYSISETPRERHSSSVERTGPPNSVH
ncbi:hypothetical protein PM082_013267 [Marasmius tenuissimus]|nr:hypothetical protein PM082_013267 [Marasmius tenuissimus]